MIKLNQRHIQKIAEGYNLGSLINVQYIEGGYDNYSFEFKTDKGDFIVQIIGDVLDRWRREKLMLQFRLLRYLKEKGFPYETPIPLKNAKGNYLMKVGDHHLWVYKKVNGEIYKRYNLAQFRKVAKALAVYHNYVKPLKSTDNTFFDFEELLSQYEKIENRKPQNKVDRLVLKYVGLFKEILNTLMSIDFQEDMLITHSDFCNENLLFKGDSLRGIIDFNNLEWAPSAKDIAIAIKRTNYGGRGYNTRKARIFLKEYGKYRPISEKTKKLIIPALLREKCTLFLWVYAGLKKKREERYDMLLEVAKGAEHMFRVINKSIPAS